MSQPPLAERIAAVRDRISESCRRAGRAERSVRLVAVSKKRPAADIEAAAALGVTDFGENRIQEAAAKLPGLRASITPHLIGHLQRNKARQAAGLFPVIQSVDSVALATRLSGMVSQGIVPPGGPPIRVLAQVDLAGEAAKFGIPEAGLPRALEEIGRTVRSAARRAHADAAVRSGSGGRSPLVRPPPGVGPPVGGRRVAASRSRTLDGHESRLRGGHRRGRHDDPGRDRDLWPPARLKCRLRPASPAQRAKHAYWTGVKKRSQRVREKNLTGSSSRSTKRRDSLVSRYSSRGAP